MKLMPLMPLRRSQGRVPPSPPPPIPSKRTPPEPELLLQPVTKPLTRSNKVVDPSITNSTPTDPLATNHDLRVTTRTRDVDNGDIPDPVASTMNGDVLSATSTANPAVTVLRNGTRVLHAKPTPAPPTTSKGVKRPHDAANDAKTVKYPKKIQTTLQFPTLRSLAERNGQEPVASIAPGKHELRDRDPRQEDGDGWKRARTSAEQTAGGAKVKELMPTVDQQPFLTPKPPGLQATQSTDKRTLRSQDGGTRMKSDLAIYFANYDDIISGVPKPRDILDVDSKISIIDEPIAVTEFTNPPSKSHNTGPSQGKSRRRSISYSKLEPTTSHHTSNGVRVVQFPIISPSTLAAEASDPLPDSHYFKAHRRAERKEKQLRNIEKERAQHEKVQLERLLEGLQGPDWLKVMGVSGVTEGEKKIYEERRGYFVREVRALVDKFRVWKEEERRLRMEKEQAQHAKDAADGESDCPKKSRRRRRDVGAHDARSDNEDDDEGQAPAPRHPHDSDSSTSDVGAFAAQQLLAEATSAAHLAHGSPAPSAAPFGAAPPAPPPPPKPFTSFFAKPHLRAQAMGQQRHGRKTYAFGVAVADVGDREFELPEEMRTEQVLQRNARRRRRVRRGTVGEQR